MAAPTSRAKKIRKPLPTPSRPHMALQTLKRCGRLRELPRHCTILFLIVLVPVFQQAIENEIFVQEPANPRTPVYNDLHIV